MKRTNWEIIRADYENNMISYRKLALKYNVVFSTLEKKARREHWRHEKEQIELEVATKVATRIKKRVVSQRTDRILNKILPAVEATDLLNELMLKALRDPDELFKYLVEIKRKTPEVVDLELSSGKISQKLAYSESTHTEMQIFDRVDTQRMNQLATTLKVTTELRRLIDGVMSAGETAKLALQRESLDLDKQRAVKDAEASTSTIRIVWGGVDDKESLEDLAE